MTTTTRIKLSLILIIGSLSIFLGLVYGMQTPKQSDQAAGMHYGDPDTGLEFRYSPTFMIYELSSVPVEMRRHETTPFKTLQLLPIDQRAARVGVQISVYTNKKSLDPLGWLADNFPVSTRSVSTDTKQIKHRTYITRTNPEVRNRIEVYRGSLNYVVQVSFTFPDMNTRATSFDSLNSPELLLILETMDFR